MNINELSEAVIGSAIEVHRELGAGLLESSYEMALCGELSLRSIEFKRQVELPVIYKGTKLDCGYRIDLIIADLIVIEIKSVEKIEKIHEAQLLTYLKLSGPRLGLLINFNVPLLKDGIKRRVLDLPN